MEIPIRKIKKGGFKKKTRNAQAFFIWQWYKDAATLNNKRIVNHENIHFRQQVETGFIFGWIIWALLLVFNALTARQVYWEHPWEYETHENDQNLDYLKTRKPWAWVKYIGRKRKRDARGNYKYDSDL